ncbi:class I SAM-dependent methyltransferase [Staphylococcus cornubiensis]|uniref:class I SAM-dependent methyltransferase n=1 Tax=Staphylococcus cornubiensis TaxID=1986155 RepID=UPI000A3C1435|nr:class I SAM-dependent methyltransferase [Staphylococcus cornubiensis]
MEFMDVFEKWAERYDETVFNTVNDNEYEDVFAGYTAMLDGVVDLSEGRVLEIGAGTGNLTTRLIQKGLDVTAIDPSEDMRKIANQKEGLHVWNGHFLDVPTDTRFETIVSTFAFHHLNHDSKREALTYLKSFLNNGGQVILVDTLFESEGDKAQIIKTYRDKRYVNLVADLETEYYPFKDELASIVDAVGGKVEFTRLNTFAWRVRITFEHV